MSMQSPLDREQVIVAPKGIKILTGLLTSTVAAMVCGPVKEVSSQIPPVAGGTIAEMQLLRTVSSVAAKAIFDGFHASNPKTKRITTAPNASLILMIFSIIFIFADYVQVRYILITIICNILNT